MSRVCPECGKDYPDGITRCPEDGAKTYAVGSGDKLVGKTIDDRFTITSLLGKGGMGAVYRARQHSMDRDVAIKVLRRNLITDKMAVQRFHREAKAASLLRDPHTVTVFDFGQTKDDLLYIVMEMLRGVPLSKIVNPKSGPMAVDRAVGLVIQVLEALAEAHDASVLHRDLKPDNIFLLERKDPGDFVKVLDFGIAKVLDDKSTGLTSTGMVFGTPTYMSPEQAQGLEMDERGDLYSVGVLLFELLVGKPPFTAKTPLALMYQKVNDAVPTIYHVNPDVQISEPLELVISRLLSIKPEERPANAGVTKKLLLDAVNGVADSRVPLPDVILKGGTTKIAARREPGTEPPPIPTVPRLDISQETILPDKRPLPWFWISLVSIMLVLGGLVGIAWLIMGDETEAVPESPATVVVPDPKPADEGLVVVTRKDVAPPTAIEVEPEEETVDVPAGDVATTTVGEPDRVTYPAKKTVPKSKAVKKKSRKKPKKRDVTTARKELPKASKPGPKKLIIPSDQEAIDLMEE